LLEAWAPLALVATSFAATNVDNLALLVGWLLTGRTRRGQVLAGHLLGMLCLLLLSFGFGLGAELFPVRYVGALGIVPILLGLKGLWDLLRAHGRGESVVATASGKALPVSIASTQVANGVDTVLVFGPLLADSQRGVDLLMIGGFGVMAAVWYGLARLLERHAARLTLLERYGHWVAPIVLIAVGVYILDNTLTDVMPGD
jgi:cadmium resistance protein CadD (predicted permease)